MGEFSINKLPKDVQLDVVHKIKKIRKNRGLTQEELANKSGVSFGSIKRFETSGQISFESLLKIVHVLGKLEDFDLILNENEHPNLNKLFSI